MVSSLNGIRRRREGFAPAYGGHTIALPGGFDKRGADGLQNASEYDIMENHITDEPE